MRRGFDNLGIRVGLVGDPREHLAPGVQRFLAIHFARFGGERLGHQPWVAAPHRINTEITHAVLHIVDIHPGVLIELLKAVVRHFHPRTRGKLIKAAREAFATKGYADSSMDDLTAQAGLTRGALYHHFGDKKGLLQAVITQIDEEMMARLSVIIDEAATIWDGFIDESM